MDVSKIVFLLAGVACVGHGRRMHPGTRILQSRQRPKSSGQTASQGTVNLFSAFTAPLLASQTLAAWHHPPGIIAQSGRKHIHRHVSGVSMQEKGTRVSVEKQFAIDVSNVTNPERPPLDYVRLPAEKYNLLDSSAVTRLDDNSFRVAPGRQKLMLIGELNPEFLVRLNVGERGVQQVVNRVMLKAQEGKKPGMILDQFNKTIRGVSVTNTVAALPSGEIACRIAMDGHFTEGLMAKVPEKLVNKVFEASLVVAMPWFMKQIRQDYTSWASGKDTREETAFGEMQASIQKGMQEYMKTNKTTLPPGMRELSVQELSVQELIGIPSTADSKSASEQRSEPLLLRAARGETVERTPVWMMRQAGRHMAAYRSLIEKYPTFRERSEIPEVSREISLQPWEAYGTDGVILFSDILTPLPAMGIDFSISEAGGITIDPIRTREAFKRMTEHGAFNPERDIPFVGSVLGQLREAIAASDATVLGFVGLPFTLGTYLIEGATGKKTGFAEVAALRASDPELCHDILSLLAKNIAQYAIYQIDNGAQVIQVFDSWAGHLEPAEFDKWAAPYQKQVVSAIKEQRPDVPVIIYMAPDTHSEGGQLLPRLAASGADVVSVDYTIDLAEAKKILADAGFPDIGLQGNLDPEILRDGPPERILAETERILKAAGNTGHVMNLGHGIESTTPEQYAALFVNAVHDFKHSRESELVTA